MATSATKIFGRHPSYFKSDFREPIISGRGPFRLPQLHFVRDASKSRGLNRIKSGAVILAGSGMCTGGRVRHHIKHNLWRPESSIIFVGYAAKGTLARILVDGAKSIKLLGEHVSVKAHTLTSPVLLLWIALFFLLSIVVELVLSRITKRTVQPRIANGPQQNETPDISGRLRHTTR